MNSPLFLFHAAKEYFENGTLYASKYFKMNKDGSTKPFDTFIHSKLCVPATNLSFSLELVFKGFLMQSNVTYLRHDLAKLYELLDIDFKKRIIEHYKNHNTYKNYMTVKLIDGDGTSHGKIEKFYSSMKEEDFIPSMLEKHKLAFIDFRYLHEFKGNQEWLFDFKEFSNFTFSALSILGQTLSLAVVPTPLEERL